jgi:hypothetical protein
LALARLRPDGWAGYEQVDLARPAQITTAPVVCNGAGLQLSADVGKDGSVKVTLLDSGNRELAVSRPVTGTVTDALLQWKNGFSLKKLKGKACRLRFELRGAKLYSFGFDLKSRAAIVSAQSAAVKDPKEDVARIVAGIKDRLRKKPAGQ